MQKKRIAKAHYKSLGKVSAYRTIVKSLPCERIIDYLILGLTKARTQDIVQLVAFQDRHSETVPTVTEARMLTAMQMIKSVSTLDKMFNLDDQAFER